MAETALSRLVEAAIRFTGNDDIQHLDVRDVRGRVVAMHGGGKPWPDIGKTVVYENEFIKSRSAHMEQHKISCEDGGCIPSGEAYDQAMRKLDSFLANVKSGHNSYDNLLDVFCDRILQVQHKDVPNSNDFRVLGAYTDGAPITRPETWMEVGAGYNALRLIDALNHHPRKDMVHLVIVDNDKECVCDPATAYAKRLKMKNITVIHADAGGMDFRLKLMNALGNRKVDKIRENQMLIYLADKKLNRSIDVGVRNFLDTCHKFLAPGGLLITREHEHFSPVSMHPDLREKHGFKEFKMDGHYHHLRYRILELAGGKFTVESHRLEGKIPKPVTEPTLIHRVTKLRKKPL